MIYLHELKNLGGMPSAPGPGLIFKVSSALKISPIEISIHCIFRSCSDITLGICVLLVV